MTVRSPHLLFAVSSLGLGHATRSLPIIRSCLDLGWRVSLLSHGNALAFLHQELRDQGVIFHDFAEYPKLERGRGAAYFVYLAMDLLTTVRRIRQEGSFVKQRHQEYDCIIADGRYGICSPTVPSFLISHQLSFIMPKGLTWLSGLADRANRFFLRRFDAVLIPDFPEERHSLSGRLSHNRVTDSLRHCWLGLLSSYSREEEAGAAAAIDYLFIVSGYLHEQRQSFVGRLLEQARALPGRKVFVLGNARAGKTRQEPEKELTIYPVATGALRNQLFNQARVIVSRSGYTTVMDLAAMGKPAVLFATPNQTEQEYLADYLGERGWYATSRDQDHFTLAPLVSKALSGERFVPPWGTRQSLARLHAEVARYRPENRFAIVIPACNEARYIGLTLERLLAQDYPRDRCQIVVVENGSTDDTAEIVGRYAQRSGQIRMLRCPAGVSRARNQGFAGIRGAVDWVLFLDADTLLAPGFLTELNRYLGKRVGHNLAIGTTAMGPADASSAWARGWFKLFDLGHRLTRTSYALQIVRAEVAARIGYDESLNYSEDLDYLKQARRYGRFFFFQTASVQTSARRFEETGYLRQFLLWLLQALQPVGLKKGKKYRLVR